MAASKKKPTAPKGKGKGKAEATANATEAIANAEKAQAKIDAAILAAARAGANVARINAGQIAGKYM